ncbi:kinesin-like protein KIF14 [Myotis daubentonii]|uniref:kinesin-like protein KIF14 n=1 Tax=Myotis daubentonii TaxID=98922 RepID=UPI002873DB1E|nr:kinesin-like protein KIF14 [Myotis daubentonii]
MSVYTAHRGHSSGLPGAPASQRSSSPDGLGLGSSRKQLSSSDVSERENDDSFLRSARRLRDINSTYVISACKTPGDTPLTPNPAGRLTLQRRVTRNKESSLLGSEVGESSERKTETRLKLQRCVRAGSVDKRTPAGADSVDRQATAGADSVDRRTPAGADSVDRRTPAGADSVDRRTPAGADSVDRRTPAGADSVDRRTPAGADSVDRRTPAGADSVDRQATTRADSTTQSMGGAAASGSASRDTRIVNNEKHSSVALSAPSAEDSDTRLVADEKGRGTFSALRGANDSVTREYFSHSTPIRPQKEAEEARPGRLATKPFQSPLDVRVSGTGSWRHRNLGEDVAKNRTGFESLGKGTPTKRTAGHTWTPRCGTPQPQSAAMSTLRPRTPSSQGQQKPKRSLFANKREGSQEHTIPPTEEAAAQRASTERDPLKAESSQVTVAVRVRPFSKREKDEDAAQVVFLDGEEIAVRHPDLRQVYSFLYDVSFWSFDACHPRYASQAAVYETLAAPLLARALEGYNACLFAYGQTGSGKSYTMMGFGEEPGIIPRFCEDLFAQVARPQTQEVRYHLEMSFFEVYNEKIHDLLVGRGDGRQGKQALRVREHPVSGPYVEALAVNAVGSYSDIQGWLQLGSKQRATAATGMNDKSSRSHSVLTLLLTRTQTELVDGEEHDHTVTSRISLVDLAGSERQGPAGTSGQQLREGVSINKSLLTLGKVISALAEHGGRRRAFIPYRESVLTWLLKESLGGNSKTAMIATVSPAASSLEETLSTLRYARQARSIVNRARVNEDASAQLIRELKAEIEKLKAAQRSRQNIDPERYRLCRQEITSLRMKLHEQERAMLEMQRAWKEKFEQAEQRKHHEIKELQKAGITFQVDDRLPNLVNLSEDPQLSETLLYVIREGTTVVGKRGPTSRPDIQLSGALVADEHCTISHVDGTVSITPVGEARTYVNGKHVLGPTVLHHGDRVVLGGDHYFRLNHPAEARSGKRPPREGAPASEGLRDFEFAKSEWLAAQRSQLEAEIQEAQLRAKQEMLQGIQVAKEVAEQELSSQRAAFEGRIEALQAELKEESQRKRLQEVSNQKAHLRIEELERAKQRLEQEVQANRRRLQLERLAAQQALDDHSVRHTRILEALEAEKQKIAQEVQALQQNRGGKDRAPPVLTSWGSLKLSLMIQEANALSGRSQRQYVFGRHEAPDGGGGPGPRVRVRNLRLGVSTLWSLEKFESKLAALKELEESNCQCEDLFCDPEDEWEPDLTDAPAASFSRRRSRSLVKNRRVSSYLHGLQAHAAPGPPSSRSSGSGEKPGSLGSSAASSLPGICRELIGSSLAVLGRSGEEETVADGLVDSLLRVHGGLLAISQAHAAQDEDSPDDLFSADPAAQARAVQVACAFGQLAVLAPLWPGDPPPGPHAARLGEELRQEVEKLGSYLQVFLQGCSSDLPSMVTDAQRRAAQAVRQAVACAGQLAVLSGSRPRLLDPGAYGDADAQEDLVDALWDGVGAGVRLLIDSGLERAEELRRELSGQRPQSEATQQLRTKAEALIGCLETVFAEWRTKSSRTPAQGEPSGGGALREMAGRAPEMLDLTRCLEQTIGAVISALRGRRGDGGALRTCVERVCVLAGDGGADSCAQSRGDLTSAAKSLLLCFEAEDRPDLSEPWDACPQNSREGRRPPGASRTSPAAGRGVPKRLSALPSRPPRSSGERAPSGTQWV